MPAPLIDAVARLQSPQRQSSLSLPESPTASEVNAITVISPTTEPEVEYEVDRSCCEVSGKCHCRMPRLVPIMMEPRMYSGVAVPLAALAKIEKIEVTRTIERGHQTLFLMDVYLKTSRIPVSNSIRARVRRRMGAEAPRKPDYSVESRFSDFAVLRQEVSELMCENARFVCEYCHEFEEYIRFRVKQPRWIVKVTTHGEQRKKVLESFIVDFVRMAQLRFSNKCLAHENVPYIVADFVRRREPAETTEDLPRPVARSVTPRGHDMSMGTWHE